MGLESIKKAERLFDEWEKQRKKLKSAFLAPDVLLRYLVGNDNGSINDLINLAIEGKIRLVTSDYGLYEAVGCLEDYEYRLNKLVKLLFALEIVPSRKILLTRERIYHLRQVAFKEL